MDTARVVPPVSGNDSSPPPESIQWAEDVGFEYGDDCQKNYVEEFELLDNALPVSFGYAVAVLCFLGILGSLVNIFNIILLRRKNLFTSTYAIMAGIAVSDLMVMILYIPYVIQIIRVDQTREEEFSLGNIGFRFLRIVFLPLFNTISNWMTIVLATWRFLAVSFPIKSKVWCSKHRAKYVICGVYLLCSVLFIPRYLTYTIKRNDGGDLVLYNIVITSFAKTYSSFPYSYSFYLRGVFTKILPSVLLAGLTLGLILVLYRAAKTRGRLSKTQGSPKERSSSLQTTRMVLAVMLLFLATELPWSLYSLVGMVLRLHQQNYFYFSDIAEIVALVNNAVSFVVYCVMSRQFRSSFFRLFGKSSSIR